MKAVKITLPSGKTKTVFLRDDQWKAIQLIVKRGDKTLREILDTSFDYYRLSRQRTKGSASL
jgi:hypothetical protein